MLIKNFGSQIKMPTTLGVSEIIRKLEIIKGYILIGVGFFRIGTTQFERKPIVSGLRWKNDQ